MRDEALLQQLEIGKPVRCEKLVELLGQFGFAGSVMSQPEEKWNGRLPPLMFDRREG